MLSDCWRAPIPSPNAGHVRDMYLLGPCREWGSTGWQPMKTSQSTSRTHASPSAYLFYMISLNGTSILCELIAWRIPPPIATQIRDIHRILFNRKQQNTSYYILLLFTKIDQRQLSKQKRTLGHLLLS